MALRNPFDNSGPENDPARDNGNDIPTWDGRSPYSPFLTSTDGGGGGGGSTGGGYVAPVTPNPLFIPPSYSTNTNIKIHLIANEAVQFTEDNVNAGIGTNITLAKTLLSFGSEKIYNAILNGKKSKNYFTVSIEKTNNNSTTILATQTINDDKYARYTTRTTTNNTILPTLTFGGPTANTSVNDYLYSESISVKEYQLDSVTNTYKFINERKVNKSVGTVDLRFEFLEKNIGDIKETPIEIITENKDVNYRITFNSNFENELGNVLSLKYEIVDRNNHTVKTNTIRLSDKTNDLEKIGLSVLKDSKVNFTILGTLPSGYAYNNIYYTPANTKIANTTNQFDSWIRVGTTFSVTGKDISNGLVVNAQIKREEKIVVKPILNLSTTQYDKEVKDSDNDSIVNIKFTTSNADYVDVYTSAEKVIRVTATKGYAEISFRNEYSRVYGKKKLILVPVSNTLGSGDRKEVIINFTSVNDFPSITEILSPTDITIPSFSDGNISYDVIYRTFAATSVDVELLYKDKKSGVLLYKNLPANGSFKISLKDLAKQFPKWNGSDTVILVFKPYNRGGARELIGNEYEVSTKIFYPNLKLDEDIIRKSIYDAFHSHLKFSEPDLDSKYLTHLANFGNDEHILISSWEEDNWTLSEKKVDDVGNTIVTNEVKSVILKLYSPLGNDIQPNSTFWITKLMTNPLIETVILNEQDTIECPPIKGPNFQIDVDFVKGVSTGYESLDDLILESKSSTKLIETYLSASSVSLDDLNIEYISGSIVNNSGVILWNNFVNYSSAQERFDNFIYKVKLIENYEGLLISASSGAQTASLAGQQEISRLTTKKSSLINDFDGFEKLMYNVSDTYTMATSASISWPYYYEASGSSDSITNISKSSPAIVTYTKVSTNLVDGDRAIISLGLKELNDNNYYVKVINSTNVYLYYDAELTTPVDSQNYTQYSNYTGATISKAKTTAIRRKSDNIHVSQWYNKISDFATKFDVENPNYLVNNIPNFIKVSTENENFLLFFSMVGHHFDNIYYYTKAIERGRGMGYKAKDGIPDRLLFDTLKSFDWDAKNLGSSDQLWKYVFGEDSAGNQKQSNPTKTRTNEVWRRIVNNLPYLLKHKGSRRGIYALMACYGVPSSNLSIIEFGGPEITDETKNKLLMDDVSHVIKMTPSSYITIPWNNTVTGRKPDTIEFFIKPAYSGDMTVVDGTNWSISVSGSSNSLYGKVKFTSGVNVLTSSLVPIFNDRFFAVELSRTVSSSNHIFELNTFQADRDREIFSVSSTKTISAASSNWETPTTIKLGATSAGFSGSVDEFRLWNTPLSRSIFIQHGYYPEMINGNHISSSTADLNFRLDFEYPKNLSVQNKLINVSPNIYFSASFKRNDYEDGNVSLSKLYSQDAYSPLSASAGGFANIVDYPYNFDIIDRDVVLELPDIGASRYATNKVRIEEQTLISDLSSKTRSTVKSFDDKPIDSNRVGLFFSPNKELNLDIAKSLGGANLDNYIGDPSARYSDTYSDLNALRDYYFKRIKNRDIYEYINAIRLYEKVMFDDIKKMLPARSKPTTGILIEPHFLERSKRQYTKPTGEDEQLESIIEHERVVEADCTQYETLIKREIEFSGENEQLETIVVSDYSFDGENYQYESTIQGNDILNVESETENYEVVVNAKLELPTITAQTKENYNGLNQLLSKNEYVETGFGLYASGGYAIRNYYDESGILVKDRVIVNLVTKQYSLPIQKYKYSYVVGGKKVGDPRGGFVAATQSFTEVELIVQPFGSSTLPTVSPNNNIIKVTPVDGYLPTHNRFTSDLTTGMQNAYYNGCKNTAATTLDGTEPIEVFVTNPNTVKVSKRDMNEPILEVD